MRKYSNGWDKARALEIPGLIEGGAVCMEDLKPSKWLLDELKPHKTILDFGCGPGRNTFELASRGHIVTAFDFPNMIQMLRDNPQFNTGKILNRIIPDFRWIQVGFNRYDAIFACLVFQHMPADVADEYMECMVEMTDNLLVYSRSYMDYEGGRVIDALTKRFKINKDMASMASVEKISNAMDCAGEEHFLAWFKPIK